MERDGGQSCVLCFYNQEQQMFCPGTWEKPDLKAEYLDFWVAANLVNSTHAPESFSLKVAQEEQGKQVKELWVLN